MQLIQQDHNSTTCGQCSVAMISDKTLDEIIKIAGDDKPMNLPRFRDIMDVMRIGYEVKFYDGDAGYYEPYSGRGLLRIAMAEDKFGMGHAVAFEDGLIYDPMNAKPFSNIVELCMAYLQVTGEVWIVDFVIYTEFKRGDGL